MSNPSPVFWENKKSILINLSSTELALKVVKMKYDLENLI